MKPSIALVVLLAGALTAFALDAAAAGEAGMLILSKNPQLSAVPDWPKPTGVSEPVDCNKDMTESSLEKIRQRGETAYRCLVVGGTFGGQPWESGGGATAEYILQLHPNSPTVWRVFKRDEARVVVALIAEFDATGKLQYSQSARSPTTLLTSSQTAPRRGGQVVCSTWGCARIQGESWEACAARLKGPKGADTKVILYACGWLSMKPQ